MASKREFPFGGKKWPLTTLTHFLYQNELDALQRALSASSPARPAA
jgi:hypothetical protein